MQWSPGERQKFLGKLDGIERVLVVFSRMMLGLLIGAVFVVVGIVVVKRPWGAGNQGEWFYFTIAVLMVLGWAVGQFITLGRRLSRRDDAVSELPFSLQSSQQDGGQKWELRFGSGPTAEGSQFGFSQTFEIPLASVKSEMLPDEATISRVAAEIDRGATLEEACQLVQPHFDHWSRLQQKAFALYVSRVLDQRANDGHCAIARGSSDLG